MIENGYTCDSAKLLDLDGHDVIQCVRLTGPLGRILINATRLIPACARCRFNVSGTVRTLDGETFRSDDPAVEFRDFVAERAWNVMLTTGISKADVRAVVDAMIEDIDLDMDTAGAQLLIQAVLFVAAGKGLPTRDAEDIATDVGAVEPGGLSP